MLNKKLLKNWYPLFEKWNMLYIMDEITTILDIYYSTKDVYPDKNKVFRVFQETNPEDVKIIILGQDPYPNLFKQEPSACGRAFATENGYFNPSLRNIFKELKSDLGIVKEDLSLQSWVDQGVFLLNTALTVEAGKTESHLLLWRKFTQELLSNFSKEYKPVWILLGSKAQSWEKYIVSEKIIKAAHPSPLAGGRFSGSKIFSKTNQLTKIQW